MPEPPNDVGPSSASATKRCDYCGKESDEQAPVCNGCGTAFPPGTSSTTEQISNPQPGSADAPAELGARSATIILLMLLAGQFGGSFLVGLAAAISAQPNAASFHDPKQTAAVVQKITPLAMTAAMLGGGGAMLLASFRTVRASLRDRSPLGAAWVLGSGRHIAAGCGLGALAAIAYLALALIPALRMSHFTLGPLARMAMTPGLAQALWFALALLLAPPIEELLFRGVLYGGYRRSFGPTKAALLTTCIFCLMHITEVIGFPPGVVGIAGMAVAALWMRLRSGAVGPAVAVHLAYNGVLALLLFAATHAR